MKYSEIIPIFLKKFMKTPFPCTGIVIRNFGVKMYANLGSQREIPHFNESRGSTTFEFVDLSISGQGNGIMSHRHDDVGDPSTKLPSCKIDRAMFEEGMDAFFPIRRQENPFTEEGILELNLERLFEALTRENSELPFEYMKFWVNKTSHLFYEVAVKHTSGEICTWSNYEKPYLPVKSAFSRFDRAISTASFLSN